MSLASEQQRFADDSGHARSIQELSSPDSIVAHRHDIADFFNSLLADYGEIAGAGEPKAAHDARMAAMP
ncbi:MAG: hypothetical protein ACHQRJ_06580 [Alphaproteobacteria bacterium]